MEINSIQGIGAYTTARPADDNTGTQNAQAADLNRDSSRAAQQAFEVTITEEARAQQTQEARASEQVAAEQLPEPPQPQNQPQQSQAAGQQPPAAPIVDIVA